MFIETEYEDADSELNNSGSVRSSESLYVQKRLRSQPTNSVIDEAHFIFSGKMGPSDGGISKPDLGPLVKGNLHQDESACPIHYRLEVYPAECAGNLKSMKPKFIKHISSPFKNGMINSQIDTEEKDNGLIREVIVTVDHCDNRILNQEQMKPVMKIHQYGAQRTIRLLPNQVNKNSSKGKQGLKFNQDLRDKPISSVEMANSRVNLCNRISSPKESHHYEQSSPQSARGLPGFSQAFEQIEKFIQERNAKIALRRESINRSVKPVNLTSIADRF